MIWAVVLGWIVDEDENEGGDECFDHVGLQHFAMMVMLMTLWLKKHFEIVEMHYYY